MIEVHEFGMETHVEPAEAGVNGMDGKGPVICLEQGKFQSTVREGVARFLAVPYAAPPCGELRWDCLDYGFCF